MSAELTYAIIPASYQTVLGWLSLSSCQTSSIAGKEYQCTRRQVVDSAEFIASAWCSRVINTSRRPTGDDDDDDGAGGCGRCYSELINGGGG